MQLKFRFKNNEWNKELLEEYSYGGMVINKTNKTFTINYILSASEKAYFETGQITRKGIRKNI